MLLGDKISDLFDTLEFLSYFYEELNPLTRRMYAMGLISEMHQIISSLNIINEQIDTSLSFEDASIDRKLWDKGKIGFREIQNEKTYYESTAKDSDINTLIDLMPLDNPNYSFSVEDAKTLKTGMQYLCSDANLAARNIAYAIDNGIKSIITTLLKIDRKKSSIKDYQYEDFWNCFLLRDDDLYTEFAIKSYESWKREHDWQDMQVLKDKRTQEIYKMLKSGIFKYDIEPVRRDIENAVSLLPEEALENGVEVTTEIKVDCARFAKYVTFKDDILCLDYVKLGKYIYNHYTQIGNDAGDALICFDNILLHIHDDMAECNPKLKPFLRFYEDDVLDAILEDALKVINACSGLLREGIEPNFLDTYMRDAFYGEIKAEVQNKLKGQSKHTVICHMLGMMKTTGRVFNVSTTSADIASALSSVVKKPMVDSLKRYIDQGASLPKTKMSRWTSSYIMEKLGNDDDRLFVKIAQS